MTEHDLEFEAVPSSTGHLRVAGLFAGIGGIERGLQRSGYEGALFCEIDPLAQAVLRTNYPHARIAPDITTLDRLPEVDVVTAGFPCQDLSVAGKRAGIHGSSSGLVNHLFRILSNPKTPRFRWLVIENVPYMLSLDRGRGMAHLTKHLEALGFIWAYRVVDARSFGIPQRRSRVYLVASQRHDPRQVVFADEHGSIPVDDDTDPRLGVPYGFYWTEGLRGVGWAGNSVPPIKGGSGLGIPSPPAVWISRTGEIGTIDLRDAERLQGFPANWTKPAESVTGARPSARWRLVGNAVCVAVPAWIGTRLRRPGNVTSPWRRWSPGGPWPRAAWGYNGKVFEVDATRYPVRRTYRGIEEFLRFPLKPLSERATLGYLKRARKCWWYISPRFLGDVERHLTKMTDEKSARRPAA